MKLFLFRSQLCRHLASQTFVASLLLVSSLPASASTFTLPTLESSQINPIFNVLAATVIFRSMEPTSHPSILGVWFNARVNGTDSSSITSILTSNQTVFPFASFQAGLNAPLGLGVEFGFLPSLSISGTTFSNFGFNAKWNFIQGLGLGIPLDSAIRFHYTTASLGYQQTLSGSPLTVNYNTSIIGGTLAISKKLLFFEPYIAYGIIKHSSSISGQGSVSLFGSSFPVNTDTVSGSDTSGWFQAGFELRLLLLTTGFQYDNAFGANTYSSKVGFKF